MNGQESPSGSWQPQIGPVLHNLQLHILQRVVSLNMNLHCSAPANLEGIRSMESPSAFSSTVMKNGDVTFYPI